MKLSGLIDALVAAGGTVDQVRAVVRAAEAEDDARRAEKRAGAAERKRRSRASRVTAVTERDGCDPLPPKESPPDPLRNNPLTPSEKQKTRGREVDPISEDWGPNQADRDFAELEGLPIGDVDREAGAFRDHWLRSGEPQADWSAAWRGWIREAIKRRRKGGGRGGGGNGSSGAPAAPGHVGERMVDLGVGRFSERMIRETWHRGEWRSFWGPKPGERGCKVPEKIFEEVG